MEIIECKGNVYRQHAYRNRTAIHEVLAYYILTDTFSKEDQAWPHLAWD